MLHRAEIQGWNVTKFTQFNLYLKLQLYFNGEGYVLTGVNYTHS